MRKQKFFTRTVISALIASGLAAPAFADTSVPVGGVDVTLGGFLASETVYRSKSLQSDISSPFSKIPFAPSTTAITNAAQGYQAYNNSEFRGTERQSRFSIEAKGHFSPSVVVTGYYEMDFLAAPNTANPNQSNSFSPRTRHVFGNIDWLDSGTHLLFGQTWSLATLETKGLDGKNAWTPLTIDAQYVVGFNWVRQWQMRLSQEFGSGLWGAISLENSQTLGATGTTTAGTYNVDTLITPGGSLFSAGAAMSTNKYPDIVAKLASDNSFGHFEIYDLARNFQSTYGTGPAAAPTTINNQKTWTNAIGLGAYIHLVPKVLDIQATYLSGKGAGRYATSQLADVTYAADGSLDVIKGTDYLLGATWNATPDWQIYGNVGQEKMSATGNFGDGFGGLKDAKESVIGFWWDAYKGNAGKVKFGMQFSKVTLDSFATAAAAGASTDDNMWFTSLRYYPGY